MADNDPAEQLAKLADLRAQGELSEAEFTAAKANVLGSPPAEQVTVTMAWIKTPGGACALGFVAVIVGSIEPWIAGPLGYGVSGLHGDGKFTVIAAVIGLVLLARKRAGTAAEMALLALGIGIYDTIHIHDQVRHLTAFGTQFAHVGWGVYVVVIGAVVAGIGALKSRAANNRAAIAETSAAGP